MPWLRWLAVVGWAELVLLSAVHVAPRMQLDPLLGYGIAFSTVCALTLASALACPPVGRRGLALAAVPCLSLLAISVAGAGTLPTAVVVTAGLLLGATLVGAVVGCAIEHPGHLIFVAIVSSAADVFSVFHDAGPSHAIVESEAALSVLALPWPMLGTSQIEPLLGAGDVVFTALYVAAARSHRLSLGRTAVALGLAFAVTMGAVVALMAPVPALPFLGLAMVLAHPAARRPPQQDARRGWLVTGAVVALVAALFVL